MSKPIPVWANMKIKTTVTLIVIQGVDDKNTRMKDQYKIEVRDVVNNIPAPKVKEEEFCTDLKEALQAFINRL